MNAVSRGTRFFATLRGAKTRPHCYPRIVLRSILRYFRPLPAGREAVVSVFTQGGSRMR